jgi:prepilin-type N-terminal cleavage/methylation domain-containing protein
LEQLQVSRLRREDGFSLPELLITLVIALVVSLATFSIVELVMKKSGETAARVEATQRGRLVMDTITRQLRSQVCISSQTPAMYSATATAAGFYVDFTDQSDRDAAPQLHQLTFDPAKGTIVEQDTQGTSNHATPPVFSYNLADPAKNERKTLIGDVTTYKDTPVFQYYAYNGDEKPRPDQQLTPGPGGLSADDLARVARIVVTFRALAPNQPGDNASIVMQDEVYVRSADPNDPAPTPTCA